MNPATVDAREAVLYRLEGRWDYFEILERKAREGGRWAEAEGAHAVILWLDRAFKAEHDDPKPKGLP